MKSKKEKNKFGIRERLLVKTMSPVIDKLLHASYDVYCNEVFGILENDNIVLFEEFSSLVLDKLKGGNS